MPTITKGHALLFLPWTIALFGWFLLLCGVAAVQADCNSSGASAIVRAGAAGYFSPTSCSKFYGFTWWITAYLFVIVVLLPIMVAINGVARFRAGLIGIISVEIMLLMDLINSFLYFNTIPTVSGALLARGRVVAAGSIIGVIGLFFVVIGLGIHDERNSNLHMKRMGVREGETAGGVYVDPDTDIANVMTYNNPLGGN